LNAYKIIAHAGIASRRHASNSSSSGQVSVNGQIVRELGSKADPAVDKTKPRAASSSSDRKPVYLVMTNRRRWFPLADPEGRKTLRNFLARFPERVYPVGNLDYAASGLIFLTNDGALTDTMLKSWSNIPQVYHIKIKGRLNLEELDALGLRTNTIVRVIRQPDSTRGHTHNFWYEAQVTGSKLDVLAVALLKDQHPIEKVKRIGLGPLSLEGVPVGHYVHLKKDQAEALRHPTRPMKFTPHPRVKTLVQSYPQPNSRKTQRFSNAYAKPQAVRLTTLNFSGASTPPNAPENFEEFTTSASTAPRSSAPVAHHQSPRGDPSDSPRAGRKPGRFVRDSKSFRPKMPRNFGSSKTQSFNKRNRFGSSSDKFKRPAHDSGRPSRHSSTRPKSHRNFPPRKPRPSR
jgi:23S rRNA pseudouridine2605 synthase